MEIREVLMNEKDTAIALSWLVFMQYVAPDYKNEGIQSFKAFIQDHEAVDALKIYGAYIEDELVGVLAIRNENHISLFFVKDEYQGQKVGKSLFDYLLSINESKTFTVNSSPYAVKIYEHLGFEAVHTQEEKDGIIFTNMVYIRG